MYSLMVLKVKYLNHEYLDTTKGSFLGYCIGGSSGYLRLLYLSVVGTLREALAISLAKSVALYVGSMAVRGASKNAH